MDQRFWQYFKNCWIFFTVSNLNGCLSRKYLRPVFTWNSSENKFKKQEAINNWLFIDCVLIIDHVLIVHWLSIVYWSCIDCLLVEYFLLIKYLIVYWLNVYCLWIKYWLLIEYWLLVMYWLLIEYWLFTLQIEEQSPQREKPPQTDLHRRGSSLGKYFDPKRLAIRQKCLKKSSKNIWIGGI